VTSEFRLIGRAWPGAQLAVWLRLVVFAALVAGLIVLLRGLRLHDVTAALQGATMWPVILAAALNFAVIWLKAAGWHAMLKTSVDVPVHRLFRYTIAALTASALTPLRTGEMFRLWLLRRRDQVPVALLASVAIGEKIIDALAMLIIVAPIAWLLPGLPAWLVRTAIVLLVIALVVVGGAFLAVRSKRGWGWLRFLEGLAVLRSGRLFALTLAAFLGAWLVDLAQVLLVLRAAHLDIAVPGALLVLFTLNVAIAIPSTPAHVGALELGAVVALKILGVPREPALAFAVLYHAMQILPLLVAGFSDARFSLSHRPREGRAWSAPEDGLLQKSELVGPHSSRRHESSEIDS
jgi:uncharacterized membrane protein YbhN (UPF0104 family)